MEEGGGRGEKKEKGREEGTKIWKERRVRKEGRHGEVGKREARERWYRHRRLKKYA